ncbi:unnamed protein product [Penicillium nalgiovense]|uniref:Uncharacterized protein n=1 Tax=Penicillium nalgiovense TaxID=60175 RepID=A0A9W4HY66_PENNA|nr:unnamed protein product [Penicillium nalgiovense]CAG7948094.1 unnamed protein product [Penicillium nalgiovense]CAG7950024.1 unnamed protein product [Penicillium nalgiovense]CAG7980482.1 unnamed protein product [Penicillium nalgiovense]CAG7988891.1 unnamed protein product [Penicillium nalgiovense]
MAARPQCLFLAPHLYIPPFISIPSVFLSLPEYGLPPALTLPASCIAMQLYLIRHAETVHNVGKVLAGTTDSALTNHGVAQVNCLAQHFVSNSTRFMTVFSSDLSRARITAEGICHAQVSLSDGTPLQPILTRNLREKDYGSMEGRFWNTSLPSPRPQGWVIPESKASMRQRADDFFNKHLLPLLMRDPHGQQNIAVVAHGIILQELWSYFIEIFNPADTKVAPGICDTNMTTLHRRPVWSNTSYTTVLITPNLTERAVLPTVMPKFAFVVLGIDDKKHLANLRRTKGGIGTAAHDVKQKRIDQFFQ